MGSFQQNCYMESRGLKLLTFLTMSLADCIFWVEAPGSPCSPIPTSISSSPSLHMYTHMHLYACISSCNIYLTVCCCKPSETNIKDAACVWHTVSAVCTCWQPAGGCKSTQDESPRYADRSPSIRAARIAAYIIMTSS